MTWSASGAGAPQSPTEGPCFMKRYGPCPTCCVLVRRVWPQVGAGSFLDDVSSENHDGSSVDRQSRAPELLDGCQRRSAVVTAPGHCMAVGKGSLQRRWLQWQRQKACHESACVFSRAVGNSVCYLANSHFSDLCDLVTRAADNTQSMSWVTSTLEQVEVFFNRMSIASTQTSATRRRGRPWCTPADTGLADEMIVAGKVDCARKNDDLSAHIASVSAVSSATRWTSGGHMDMRQNGSKKTEHG